MSSCLRMGLLLLLSQQAWPAIADSVTDTFAVTAVIESSCSFSSSSSGSSDSVDFGTINFGMLSSISSAVDVDSSDGAGSIGVECTLGVNATIALDYGLNGGSSTQRYLSDGSGNTLAYQLYQDSDRSTVWGTDTLAYSIASFPSTAQTYTVYARLFSSSVQPTAGTYTDTVTVTLTY